MKGTLVPSSLEMATAIAVFPVPGGPAKITVLPLSFPSLIIWITRPAASLALSWPTMPSLTLTAFRFLCRPRPLMWVWAPMRSKRRAFVGTSFIAAIRTSSVSVFFVLPGWASRLSSFLRFCCCDYVVDS